MTLVEFLKARLDEDERVARAAEEQWDDEDARYEWNDLPEASFAHARHHSPARVLAEVEAKRQIIEECERKLSTFVGTGAQVATEYLVLRLLALPYADHPDYDPAWHPA